MKMLDLLPIGDLDARLLQSLAPALANSFRIPCRIRDARLDPQFAFHPERGQHHSSEILQAMQRYANEGAWRVLGVTSVDLYIPILTFVFGEAQMGGPCAVVSYHRLMQQFYGLPPDPNLLVERLVKESVHEVGHTFDLTHCRDYSCAMAPSHAVEWIDLKETSLCGDCEARALELVE
ncbi:MAG: archaemetzincin family Zn-dependent metalloprotease [Terriglobales bacterium]|jgi:archaemetzincin